MKAVGGYEAGPLFPAVTFGAGMAVAATVNIIAELMERDRD